jgi:hypothetical protein
LGGIVSRQFDGVDDQMAYTVPASGLNVSGAHTLLIVVRIMATADNTWLSFLETETSAAATSASLGRSNGGELYWSQGATIGDEITATDSDGWMIAAATKPAGFTSPTLHRSLIGGANTHTAHASTLIAAASIASGTIRIGGNDDFANIRVAAAAIFDKVLSNAEIDGINTAKTTQAIYDLGPVWLVDDLDAFAADYMNNADRTAITGTADNADDPSGWVFGASAPAVPPANTVAPVASGTPTTGQVLSVTDGTWTGDPTITFTYQWQRNGVNIGSATANTYTLVEADEGNPIRCVVTGTNSGGNSSANSNAITVLDEPANSVAPAVTGTPTVGETLSCSTGTWSNSPDSYAYQWRRSGVNIGGATSSTYLLDALDEGATVVCRVTATNENGSNTADSNGVVVGAADAEPSCFIRWGGIQVACIPRAKWGGSLYPPL